MMKRIMIVAAGLALGSLLAGTALAADVAAKPVLSNSDCVKCHAKPPADIEAKGKAHKTAVGCQDCHQGHPPAVAKAKIIPQCSQCHEGKPHFKLAGCLGCHRNPHTPKEISFGRDVTDPCLTCHTPQIAQLKQSPSKHSKLNCSFCHDVHGKVPQCTQCHKSHSADIVQADCKKCHRAHMPKSVVYGNDTNSKFCAACHGKAYNLLTASKAKHKTLLCVTCHQEKHKMVPKCQDCHGVPHPAGLMNKFPRCGECHGIAHDLNNWAPIAEPKKSPAAPAAAAPAHPAPAKKK
jgi:predicted CXXCH cytochrome family protein